MDIIFIGQFVSREESLTDLNYSQAANSYQITFLKLIKPKLIISIIPIFINKHSPFSFPIDKIKFINNPLKGNSFYHKILRLYKDTKHTLNIVRDSKIRNVWFYNITISNVFIFLYIFFFTKKKPYVLVADYSFSKTNLINVLLNYSIRISKGAIVWNSNIKHKNKFVVPNILDSSKIKLNQSKVINPVIIFSGSLGKTTGFEFALEFFSKYKNYELIITGMPYHYSDIEFNYLIEKYVSPNENINFYGLVNLERYHELLRGADIALSLRDAENKEHDGNFPSKILEYLSFGKFVVSTRKYNDIDSELYLYSKSNFKSFNKVLQTLLDLKPQEILDKRKFIYDNLLKNHTEKRLITAMRILIDK